MRGGSSKMCTTSYMAHVPLIIDNPLSMLQHHCKVSKWVSERWRISEHPVDNLPFLHIETLHTLESAKVVSMYALVLT